MVLGSGDEFRPELRGLLLKARNIGGTIRMVVPKGTGRRDIGAQFGEGGKEFFRPADASEGEPFMLQQERRVADETHFRVQDRQAKFWHQMVRIGTEQDDGIAAHGGGAQ